MAALQKTYSGDLTQSIAGQIWEARQDAAALRREALSEEFIGKEVDDHKLQRGEFMGHALLARMTQMLPERFQHNMPNFRDNPEYLMRGQQRMLTSGINPQFTNNAVGAKAAGQPFPNVAVGSPLKYQQPISTRKDVVKVRDQKLGKFISEVAVSLSGSLNIMDKRMDSVDEGVVVAKEGVSVTQEQLEENGNALEDRLDAIIALLRHQNQEAARAEDEAEAAETEMALEQQLDPIGSQEFTPVGQNDVDTANRNAADNDINLQDYSTDLSPMRGPGEFEQGGTIWAHGKEMLSDGRVIDGPDTGYLAQAEKGTSVLPIDNFFTRGQTGAAPLGGGAPPGDVEKGRKVDLQDIPEVAEATEKLQRAVVAATEVAGLNTLHILTKTFESIPINKSMGEGLRQIVAPVSSMFNVQPSIAMNVVEDYTAKANERQRTADTLANEPIREVENRNRSRAWWDFLGVFTGGGTGVRSGGTSHRSTIGVRNTRHSSSMGGSRHSTNIKSNTSIGGGGSQKFNILNPFSWGKGLEEGQKAREGVRGTVLPQDGSTPGALDNMLNRNNETQRMINEMMGYGSGGVWGGGNLGESAYGGTENNRTTNINNVSNPPESRSRFVNISERSKESSLTRISRANQPLEPIVINNSSSKKGGQPQEVEHISNIDPGGAGMENLYPSMV